MTPPDEDRRPPEAPPERATGGPAETCDVCGSADIVEIRCKYICRNCRTILRTCSDL
jgi:hypothetical protein